MQSFFVQREGVALRSQHGGQELWFQAHVRLAFSNNMLDTCRDTISTLRVVVTFHATISVFAALLAADAALVFDWLAVDLKSDTSLGGVNERIGMVRCFNER